MIGSCPELTRHHMELRGLGLINVRDLFGVAATRTSKRVELVVQLERWEETREYDRLGLDDQYFELLGLRVPLVRMPVAPGPQPRHPGGGGRAQPAAARRAASMPHATLAARLERLARRCRPRPATTTATRRMETWEIPREPGVARPIAAAPVGALHRAHGSVRGGEVAGDSRARGSRLLLRRQPAGGAAAIHGRVRPPARRPNTIASPW